MNCNEFNLRQLLELALRVPEVGVVNFNILYYILKTIIEKEGLEEVKPVFILDSADPQSSYFEESLVSGKDKVKDRYDEYGEKSQDKKESRKWENIKVFKRLESVEEEISSIYQDLSKLFSKVSNLEQISGHQETRFLNELDILCQSIETKIEFGEYNVLSEKIEDLSSKVVLLMEMKEKISELKEKYEAERDFYEDTYEIQSEKSDETLQLEAKFSEATLDENEKEKKMKEIKLSELGTKEKPKLSEEESGKTKEAVKPEITERKKTSRLKSSEQEILSKIETLNEEIVLIKQHMQSGTYFSIPAREDDNAKGIDIEDAQSKQERIIKNIDLHLLNVSTELHKLIDKCDAIDKTFSREISQIKESTLILEHSYTKYSEEIETLKAHMDELTFSLVGMREDLTYMETPGLKDRINRLEESVYSVYGDRHVDISDVHKTTAKETMKADLNVFKPITEESSVEYTIDETEKSSKHLRSVTQGVLLVQDMDEKGKEKTLSFPMDLYKTSIIDDIYVYEKFYENEEEPKVPEDFQSEDSEVLKKVPLHTEIAKKDSDELVKSPPFASHELLEELKKKVVIYVKKRLHDFEIELQVLEENIREVKKKTDNAEKYSKELGEKIAFMDSNFSQRAGDIAALKNTVERHQGSIVSIMNHLERKAEAYTVNQKVSRRELAVIEDRVLKLCKTTSSEIMKLEEKLDNSFEKFSSELDKKLFIKEFEIHFDFLKHKFKVVNIKLKELSVEPTVVDFEGIFPPLQIKKYVMQKDGTKIKQTRTIVTGKTKSTPDNVIPLLCQHHPDREVSPKIAAQVQKGLELASSRESKRYVEGTYTKIKVGKK